MGVVRNSINVEGLTKESDFPNEANSFTIKYCEAETMLIPTNKPEAKIINEVDISLIVSNERILGGGFGKTIVLGGTKNYRVSYLENSPEATNTTANIQEPFIYCVDLPKDIENVTIIRTYLIDAYFHLIDSRRIYAHFIYLINILLDDTSKEDIHLSNNSNTLNKFYDLAEEIM